MMTTTTDRTTEPLIRRILFALDAVDADPVCMAAVIRLAERTGAELVGLLFEDDSLRRLAALPFASEVAHTSAALRRIDPVSMQRALRIRAESIREKFEASAGRASIRFSFRVASGDPSADQALALSPQGDLLVLRTPYRIFEACGTVAPARRVLRQAGCTVLLHHPDVDLERPVVALFDGTSAGRRVLSVAAQLARRDGMNLVVLLPARAGEGAARLRGEAREQLRPYGIEPEFYQLHRDTIGAVERAATSARADALVISAEHPLAADERYREWTPRFRRAVVLVR